MSRTVCRSWLLVLVASACVAETYYVNSDSGRDGKDGRSPERAFRTIARAVKAMKPSDTLSLAKTGTPYREPIPLVRLGGTPAKPLIIEGNGATISGIRPLPLGQWRKQGESYRMSIARPYGTPSVFVDGKRAVSGPDPEKLEPGQYAWPRIKKGKKKRGQKGTLYFRPADDKTPADYRLEATLEVSGLVVQSSSYIVVRNLISEYHSNDGFNIHGDCRGIYCENIEGRFNGDDGFSIHEAIEAVVRNGHFHHNGSGIEDVNLSRSFYSGIRVHDNHRLGVLFIGAFHSAVDAIVYNNPYNFRFTPGTTKHLLGAAHSPIRDTSILLQNVVSWGGNIGVQATRGARVMIANSIFCDCKIGFDLSGESRVHLTKSIVAGCTECEARCDGKEFFSDYNLFYPGNFAIAKEAFGPDRWEAFRAKVGHNENSVIQDPKLSPAHTLSDDSPKRLGRHSIGPTAHYPELSLPDASAAAP